MAPKISTRKRLRLKYESAKWDLSNKMKSTLQSIKKRKTQSAKKMLPRISDEKIKKVYKKYIKRIKTAKNNVQLQNIEVEIPLLKREFNKNNLYRFIELKRLELQRKKNKLQSDRLKMYSKRMSPIIPKTTNFSVPKLSTTQRTNLKLLLGQLDRVRKESKHQSNINQMRNIIIKTLK